MIPESHLIERLLGIMAGSVLAMVFLVPRTWSGLARRLTASVFFGAVFTTPLREYIGWPSTSEYIIAAACTAAFASWWIMGAGVKAMEKAGLLDLNETGGKPKK